LLAVHRHAFGGARQRGGSRNRAGQCWSLRAVRRDTSDAPALVPQTLYPPSAHRLLGHLFPHLLRLIPIAFRT
jgi:hypothetical protein